MPTPKKVNDNPHLTCHPKGDVFYPHCIPCDRTMVEASEGRPGIRPRYYWACVSCKAELPRRVCPECRRALPSTERKGQANILTERTKENE